MAGHDAFVDQPFSTSLRRVGEPAFGPWQSHKLFASQLRNPVMSNQKTTAKSGSNGAAPAPAEETSTDKTVSFEQGLTTPKTGPAAKPKATTVAPRRKGAATAAGATKSRPVAQIELDPALPEKAGKPTGKLVRDGFTMPAADFALIAHLKKRLLGNAREAKKSELLRAGLRALDALSDEALIVAIDQLERVKTGRPKKGH